MVVKANQKLLVQISMVRKKDMKPMIVEAQLMGARLLLLAMVGVDS